MLTPILTDQGGHDQEIARARGARWDEEHAGHTDASERDDYFGAGLAKPALSGGPSQRVPVNCSLIHRLGAHVPPRSASDLL
jgi:hypothetical protein